MHSTGFVRAVALAATAVLCPALAPAPRVSAAVVSAPAKLDVDYFLKNYTLIELDAASASRRVKKSGRLKIQAGSELYDVQLAPNDLRAPDYRAVETLEDGTTRPLPSEPVTTYAGTVRNRPDATARFTIEDGRVSGLILDGEDRIFVEPLATFSLAGGPNDYVVYHGSDVRPEAEPGSCGATAAEKLDAAIDTVSGDAEKVALNGTLNVVQIATDADNEYVSALGSAAAANSDIRAIMNQVDAVYQAQLGLTFQITYQNTYAGADPYTSTTVPSTLLSQFRNYWNANRTGVQRDIAHLWTGRDLDSSVVGIAYIGVVCTVPTYAYGLSQRYTSTPQRYTLTAHEIGHNFNACHSNTSCNSNPSSCTSTIMQSSISTCNLTFCSFSRTQITNYASAHLSCLPASAIPPLPSSLTAVRYSSSRINLSWLDNSTNETGFKIERSTDGVTFSWIATVGANVKSYASTGLSANRLYYYRVRAYNASGNSTYSNVASARTST